jgi:dienelactone hydrolase
MGFTSAENAGNQGSGEEMDEREWLARRTGLLDRLRAWRGELPERVPLNVIEIWRREWRTHTEIKVTYDGSPGERIPAYLLLPRDAPAGPLPAVFAAHQCGDQCDLGKEQVVGKSVDWPDQAYGLGLVREGFVVIAPDANKVGERFDPKLREPWQRVGDPPFDVGPRHVRQRGCCLAQGGSWGSQRWKPVFDVMRGVDLLVQHPRVDPTRIGMIGHSMGGDTVLWAMPWDERIRAAVISGSGLLGFFPPAGPYGLPYADILKLIAPRPLLEVTGTEDSPNLVRPDISLDVDERMRAKRDAHNAARAIYGFADASDRLGRYEFSGGHIFPPEAHGVAYGWLKRWLA